MAFEAMFQPIQIGKLTIRNRVLSTLLATIHLGLQKFAFGKKRMIGFLERFDTAWLRLSSKVAAGAVAHGKSKCAGRVFCGHTHESRTLEQDGVEYYNTGSWTQDSATYVAIDHEAVRVLAFCDPPEDSIDQNMNDELELDFENLLAD